MPRISGIDLPNEKRVDIGLTYIYGIGQHLAKQILNKLKIATHIRVKNLSDDQVKSIQKEIESIPTEGELRQMVRENIETLKRMQSYRGLRHQMKLPARGQRTKSNSRTLKGKRKTVGAMTKEARAKVEAPAAK